MMADDTSEGYRVKEEVENQRPTTNASEEITSYSNGEAQGGMEHDSVKKKAPSSRPGGAIIVSGTSNKPPIHDTPVNLGDASDYVMEYTDIFEATDNSNVVDIQEGDAIEESSDTEIVGHSNEGTRYEKRDNDSDEDGREGPPPLESEDDYEYDDSDLGFTSPPLGSDVSEGSPLLLSPTKSISSERDSGSEKAPLINSTRAFVSRQESGDSDLGYREGPPPLDSEGEGPPPLDSEGEGPPPLDSEGEMEVENEIGLNGVEKEEPVYQSDEREEEEDMEQPVTQCSEASEEISRTPERVESPEGTETLESNDVPEKSELLERTDSPFEAPEKGHAPEADEIPERTESPLRSESSEQCELGERSDASEGESSGRVVTPEFESAERQESESEDLFSNPEEPVIKEEESIKQESSELSSHVVSDDEEELEDTPLIGKEEDERPMTVFSEEEEDLKGSTEALLGIQSKGRRQSESDGESETMEVKGSIDSEDDSDADENESLLSNSKHSKTASKEIISLKGRNAVEGVSLRSSKARERVMESQKATKVLRGKPTQIREASKKNVSTKPEEKGPRNVMRTSEKKRTEPARPASVRNSAENLVSKRPKIPMSASSTSAAITAATVHAEKKPRPKSQGVIVKEENKRLLKTTPKSSSAHDIRRHAPGIAVKEEVSRGKERVRAKESVAGNFIGRDEKIKVRHTNDAGARQKKTHAEGHGKALRKSVEDLDSKKGSRSTEKLLPSRRETKLGNNAVENGEVKKQRQKQKKAVTKSVGTGTDEDTTEELIEYDEERKTRAAESHASSTAAHSRNHEAARARRSYEETQEKATCTKSIGVHNHHAKTHGAAHHGKHDRSKHIWLCRDDEIHKLIAQKASLLKEYESGSLAGRKVFSGHKRTAQSQDLENLGDIPAVSFTGSKQRTRSTRPMSEVFPDRAPFRKKENRRSLQHRCSGSSSEDDDDVTNRTVANREKGSGGTFSVGMSSRNLAAKHEEQSESDHEETCEYCAAEKAARKAQERDLAWEGPHHPRNLLLGVVYTAKDLQRVKALSRLMARDHPAPCEEYLGSSQIMSPQSPNRAVRMQQAQEAVGRIKVPEGEDQPTTGVDLFISTERIKVVNSINKEVMMDHPLRTVSFIADIGDVLVLMARRPPGEQENPLETKPSASQILASVAKAETDPKMIKITCHVFQAEERSLIRFYGTMQSIDLSHAVAILEYTYCECLSSFGLKDVGKRGWAQVIAKTIGQAFNVAYQEFLKTNGISEDSVEDAEYNCVLEAQKILGEDLSLLSDESKARELVVNKKPGEALGVMVVESGWGSMIPTAIIAHLAKDGPATKSGRLNVGDQILSINNTSLVGLPLLECQNVIKNSRAGTKVVMKVVSCPPTVQVVVNRPDTKYQLGFSVQNGMICSLMRGSIAERGGVRVGHRIIDINGQSVVATSHQHIVDLLATTVGEIRMKTMPASMYRLLVGLDTPQYI